MGFYFASLKNITIHGELHSCYVSFKQAGQISDDEYEQLDTFHYKVEKELLKLIESLNYSSIPCGWHKSKGH